MSSGTIFCLLIIVFIWFGQACTAGSIILEFILGILVLILIGALIQKEEKNDDKN